MLRRFLRYIEKVYAFGALLSQLRDERRKPIIPADVVLRSTFLMFALRLGSLNALEQYLRHADKRVREWVGGTLSADTVGYCASRFDLDTLRNMLRQIYLKLRRNNALKSLLIGGLKVLAIDGHELFCSYNRCCPLCCQRTVETRYGKRVQYYHRVVSAEIIGGALALPLDIESILPGEDEVAAASRLFARVCCVFPKAFEVVTVDALYAQAGFLNLARSHNKDVITVLKDDRRELLQDATSLFEHAEPTLTWEDGSGKYAVWDDEGFLTWPSVNYPIRVVQSVEEKVDKKRPTTKRWVWVATMLRHLASTKTIWRIGHARWDIENRLFNEAVNCYGLDRAYKHHPQAILFIVLTLMIGLTLINAFYLLNIKPEKRLRLTKKLLVELFKQGLQPTMGALAPT
jgi:hypothetical protein